jgi:dTMP kinase
LGRLLKSRLNFPHKCPIRQIRMANTHNSILNGGDSESRGALIVLEGLDRSGKTSQSSRLLTYLEGLGHSAELWRFPDRNTNVGQMISSYLSNKSQLDDHTIHLLFSANRWEKRFVMLFLCSMLCSGLTDFVCNLKYLVSSNSSSLLVLRIRKKKSWYLIIKH